MIEIMDLFAGLGVTDYARGRAWVERLLGRPPAFDAHETECVFELAEHRYLYVALEPEHAGHAMVTVFLDELDAFLTDAAGRGLRPARTETYENGVRKAIFRDEDGNEIGFGGGPA
jgi:hypothetical protein